jgi:hypothetical protein
MTSQAAAIILQNHAQRAGVAALSPHDLQRTFVMACSTAALDIANHAKAGWPRGPGDDGALRSA